jgi:hypothetical protein
VSGGHLTAVGLGRLPDDPTGRAAGSLGTVLEGERATHLPPEYSPDLTDLACPMVPVGNAVATLSQRLDASAGARLPSRAIGRYAR